MDTTKTEHTVRHNKQFWPQFIYFIVGIAVIWGGRFLSSDLLMLGGCAILVSAFGLLAKSDRTVCKDSQKDEWAEDPDDSAETDESPQPRPVAVCDRAQADGADGNDALVEQMVDQSRYVLLLRPQIASGLERKQFEQVVHALDAGMALVPDGEVLLGQSHETSSDISAHNDDPAITPSRAVRVRWFFQFCLPVAHGQCYEFVVAGGYERVALGVDWIRPAMLDFDDRTGQMGRRW